MKRNTEEAFVWITNILEKANVPYKISGGFAARLYGSPRELSDIDIVVPEKYIQPISKIVKKYIIFGPDTYKDENWNLSLITLNYSGQEIDLASDEALIFDVEQNNWMPIGKSTEVNMTEVYGKVAPIETKKNLIEYKKRLAREVDLEDIKWLEKK